MLNNKKDIKGYSCRCKTARPIKGNDFILDQGNTSFYVYKNVQTLQASEVNEINARNFAGIATKRQVTLLRQFEDYTSHSPGN